MRGLTRQAALARRLDVPGFAENDSSTYETKDAAEDILAQISKQFSEDQLKRLAQSPFFSVTADGSTDIGKLHTLTIDVRYLHPKSCEVTTDHFFTAVQLYCSSTVYSCTAVLQL